MQLLFLGTGSAFCLRPGAYQSNLLLTSPTGRTLLLDCGSDIRFALRDAGLGFRDVDDIYISHLHADHVGGLEFIGFANRFGLPEPRRPGLYISDAICDHLWERSLSAGMEVVEQEETVLEDFFTVHRVPADGGFEWEGAYFELVSTVHVAGAVHNFYSYGLFFDINGTKVFLTTDTKFSPERLMPYYEQADLVLHDCEIAARPTSVHPNYRDLRRLPPAIKAKTWLYGYGDEKKPDVLADGFAGMVETGQMFDLSVPLVEQA